MTVGRHQGSDKPLHTYGIGRSVLASRAAMFVTAVRARSASRAQLAAWEANSRKLHPSEGIDGRPFPIATEESAS